MSTCTSAEDALQSGNRELLDKNYKSAIEHYNESIELDNTNADAYLKRALCNEKLRNYRDVIEDANHAITLDPMSLRAYVQKGVTSYELGDYQTAQESFEKCTALDRSDSIYPTWIEKCKSRASKGPKPAAPKSNPSPATTTTTSTASTTPSSSSSSSSSSSESSSQRPQQPQRPAQPPKPPAPKAPKAPRAPKAGTVPPPKKEEPAPAPQPEPTPAPAQPSQPVAPPTSSRYTWYQTDNFVTVTVFIKAAKPSDVQIEFEPKSLSVSIELSADNQFLLDLDLAQEINPSESKFEIMSTKIEIKMKKSTPVKWNTLEAKEEAVAAPAKKSNKNWDKILAGEEEDKSTDFTQLMKDMYACATEEERKAMMKSFHESGGTVLSADWKDVGKGYVEPKPPVGVTKWEKDV